MCIRKRCHTQTLLLTKKSDHRSDLFLRHARKDFLVSLVSCCLYNCLLCMWVRRAESETIRKFGAILLLGYFN